MSTLLISDLHLSEDTPAIEQGFYRFLEQETKLNAGSTTEQLFILGDFFEAWVGDDDDAPLAQRIAQALRDVVRGGTAVFFCRGNRDFLLGEGFAQSVGATLLADQHRLTLGGRATLLMHGDTLCTDDVNYQNFRAMAHSAKWRAEVLAKPLAERRLLAQQLRAMSIDAASNKADDIMDVNLDTVQKTMSSPGVDLLIHGHTHRPGRHGYHYGERIVLGDWSSTVGWCVRADEANVELEQFAL